MELGHIALIDGSYFQLGVGGVVRIFMSSKGDNLTFVTFDNDAVTKIPYHAVLHWT